MRATTLTLMPSYHKLVATPQALKSTVTALRGPIEKFVSDWNGTHPDGAPITHIAATGMSGQAVLWPLVMELGLLPLVIRKPGEKSHDSTIRGAGEVGDYIIVDDLIENGGTIRNIVRSVLSAAAANDIYPSDVPICRHIFLYHNWLLPRAFSVDLTAPLYTDIMRPEYVGRIKQPTIPVTVSSVHR